MDGFLNTLVVDTLPVPYDFVFGTDSLQVLPLMQALLPSVSFLDGGESSFVLAAIP